mmetsp:Transcript_13892/g.19461  ORF Transcript_13892/g.19461 Transcript_13892/m.19461 type:complete len:132 (-) Transcript_13892:195-590(-)
MVYHSEKRGNVEDTRIPLEANILLEVPCLGLVIKIQSWSTKVTMSCNKPENKMYAQQQTPNTGLDSGKGTGPNWATTANTQAVVMMHNLKLSKRESSSMRSKDSDSHGFIQHLFHFGLRHRRRRRHSSLGY